MDFLDEIVDGVAGPTGPAQTPPATPQQAGGDINLIVDEVLGGMAAPAQDTQDIQTGKDVGYYGSFVSGFSSGDDETIRYLASQLYPNEPMDKAVKRFGKREGQFYHKGDDGKLYAAYPENFASNAAYGVGKVLPTAAGTATGILTAPAMLAGPGGMALSMSATGAAAGAGDVARQKAGDYLMGDASTGEIEPFSVAEEVGAGALGQGIGAGIGGLLERGAVKEIARFEPDVAEQAYREAAAEGVTLTPAEATGLPSLAAHQKRLTNITQTSDKMRTFLDMRDGQVRDAWKRMLDEISPAYDAEDVGIAVRGASKDALKALRDKLQATAKPYYDAAYAKPVPYTTELESLLQRPAMKTALAKAKELAANEGEPFQQFFAQIGDDGSIKSLVRVPDMRAWDTIKRGLDDMISAEASQNKQTGGLNNQGRILTKLKNQLVDILDVAVPEYATAREIYSEEVGHVTSAMESALETLSKMKDRTVLRAAREVFDPTTRSPKMVTKLRLALERRNPEAWQAIKRVYMNDVTRRALRPAEGGEVINPAGKLVKAFSEDSLLIDNLRAAMTPTEFRRLKDLSVVLKRASSVPALRSDTEFNRLISEDVARAAEPVVAKGVRALNPMKWPDAIANWMTQRNLDKHAEVMVDLVTSGDREALRTMKELKRLSPKDKRWVATFGHLISQTGRLGASYAVPDLDYGPAQ